MNEFTIFVEENTILVLAITAWSLYWKGLSLWHAARRKQGNWFIALLLVNSVGLLDIFYLFTVAKVPRGKLFRP